MPGWPAQGCWQGQGANGNKAPNPGPTESLFMEACSSGSCWLAGLADWLAGQGANGNKAPNPGPKKACSWRREAAGLAGWLACLVADDCQEKQ